MLPIIEWLPKYKSALLRHDVLAGLMLAAYAMPVAVAYASLAGLPPQTGLYCYLIGGAVYAFFGTSRQLAIGPTSAISILIGSALAGLAAGDPGRQSHLAMAVSVFAGVIAILAWLLRLGNVTNFISETVLSGFKVGAGLVIASTQLPKLFGFSSGGGNFFARIVEILRHLTSTNPASLCVGLSALLLLIAGERLLPRRPVGLFVVALSIAAMFVLPLSSYGVKTVGPIPQGLPHFSWVPVRWSEIDELLALALACFLLAYVEGISVTRTLGAKHGYPINADQELLALGVANVAAGLGQGYTVAGGMSQSAVNENAGARTPMALIFAAAAIAVVLQFLTGTVRNLPQPVLAAVVLAAVRGMIKPHEMRLLYRSSKMEFRLAMLSALGVLSFGILKGVLLAAIFSILILLRRASRPRIVILRRLPGSDRFVDATRYPESEESPNVLVLRVESGLFYFNAQNVKDKVLDLAGKHKTLALVIIDLSTSANIDLAGARMLKGLSNEMARAGGALALAEVHGNVRDMLQIEELDRKIPGAARRVGIAELISRGISAELKDIA